MERGTKNKNQFLKKLFGSFLSPRGRPAMVIADYLLALPPWCAQYNDQAVRSSFSFSFYFFYVVALTCQFIFKLVAAPAGLLMAGWILFCCKPKSPPRLPSLSRQQADPITDRKKGLLLLLTKIPVSTDGRNSRICYDQLASRLMASEPTKALLGSNQSWPSFFKI